MRPLKRRGAKLAAYGGNGVALAADPNFRDHVGFASSGPICQAAFRRLYPGPILLEGQTTRQQTAGTGAIARTEAPQRRLVCLGSSWGFGAIGCM